MRASRDHALATGIALDGIPRAPAESFDLEPGESYAKWAAERGPQTLGYLLGVADHAAGYDDPGMDAALGALFILSRRAIRAALSSAKPAERESSRDELLDRLSQLEAELKRRDEERPAGLKAAVILEAEVPEIIERGARGEALTLSEQAAWTGYELGWRDGNAETHPALKAAGGWRPIESAPKDGAALLILADGVVSQARYQGPSDGAIYSGSVSRYNWFCETSCRSIYDLNVTHWMPLPPAPGSLALGAVPEGGEERGPPGVSPARTPKRARPYSASSRP